MQTYTIQFTEKQLTVIGSALGVRPYMEVVETLNAINLQLQTQQQIAHDKAADAADRASGSPGIKPLK